MSQIFRILATAAIAVSPAQALAHGGHLGELAGHSHWIGLAALGIAAGLIALLPQRKRKTEEDSGEAASAEDETKDTAGAEA